MAWNLPWPCAEGGDLCCAGSGGAPPTIRSNTRTTPANCSANWPRRVRFARWRSCRPSRRGQDRRPAQADPRLRDRRAARPQRPSLPAQAQPRVRHQRRPPDQVPAAPHYRHQLHLPDPAHRRLPVLPGQVRGRRGGLGGAQALVAQDRRAGAARLRRPVEMVVAALRTRGPADLGDAGATVHGLGSAGLRALAAEPVSRREARDHGRTRVPAAADAGNLLARRPAADPDRARRPHHRSLLRRLRDLVSTGA